jgi:hypothetical protein
MAVGGTVSRSKGPSADACGPSRADCKTSIQRFDPARRLHFPILPGRRPYWSPGNHSGDRFSRRALMEGCIGAT